METESYVHLKTYLTAAYCKLHTVECLMKLLESGRANTLKDALNLYEDILHKARMEELQQQQLLIGQDILKNQDLQKKYAQQTVQSAYLTNGLIVLNYLKSGDNS